MWAQSFSTHWWKSSYTSAVLWSPVATQNTNKINQNQENVSVMEHVQFMLQIYPFIGHNLYKRNFSMHKPSCWVYNVLREYNLLNNSYLTK